jgi:hypothetical protein
MFLLPQGGNERHATTAAPDGHDVGRHAQSTGVGCIRPPGWRGGHDVLLHDRQKTRSLVLGNLAFSCYIRQRQLDAAGATLHRAIDLLEQSRGRRRYVGGIRCNPRAVPPDPRPSQALHTHTRREHVRWT